MTRIGVLALQGDFEAHHRMLRGLGVEAVEVRQPHRLENLNGLVLPGGESTTLLNLMRDEPWFGELRRYHARGGAILATCAGAILLSREVRNPPQPSLGLLDAVIQRNGYGRQVDSFETQLEVEGYDGPLHAVFIRAPRFLALGPGVDVLARLGGEHSHQPTESAEPVLVRQGRILAGTFHPELTADSRLHGQFVALASGGGESRSGRYENKVEAAPSRRLAIR
jgi:5'-phosphate synthase pdxT subunit